MLCIISRNLEAYTNSIIFIDQSLNHMFNNLRYISYVEVTTKSGLPW